MIAIEPFWEPEANLYHGPNTIYIRYNIPGWFTKPPKITLAGSRLFVDGGNEFAEDLPEGAELIDEEIMIGRFKLEMKLGFHLTEWEQVS